MIKKLAHSPVSKHLFDSIKATGPMSVGSFMRQALTHPLGGYYMQKDAFGSKGDFVTSPEISQLFGEMVGVWTVLQWKNMKSPSKVRLVELGPGRGTLMSDILRTIDCFPMKNAISAVSLVEASPFLEKIQSNALQKYEIPLEWHQDLDFVSDDIPTILVAHEFFDALPIYQFQLNESKQWREIMVEIDESLESESHFKFVQMPNLTEQAVNLALSQNQRFDPKNFEIGDRIEVSPESWQYAYKIASLVSASRGAALVIDYGQDKVSSASLRGIYQHRFQSPLIRVGESDLTADVDFALLKEACKNVAKVNGPITQAEFLFQMGIEARRDALIAASKDSKEKILAGYNRLVSTTEMGQVYKAMEISVPILE